jgi:hypothetical protein
VGSHDVVYTYLSQTYTLTNAFTVANAAGGDSMNPTIFDLVNQTPDVLYASGPTDPTKSGLFVGVGNTFYVWNPSTLAWDGIITP